MQFHKKNFLIFVAITILSACKKDNKANQVKSSPADVYLAGYIRAANSNSVASYWKNDTLHELADSSNNSSAWAIVVNSNDVYVLGNRYNPNGGGFTYWKNGVPTDVNSGTFSISGRSMAVQNGNVYVAGVGLNNPAAYWLNGTEMPLNTSGYHGAFASAIAVNGNDVYVVGYAITNAGVIAILWKNSIPTVLANTTNSFATDIIISENDIYVAGTISGSAAYWKNGVAKILSQNSGVISSAYGIAVNGTDVYLTGYTTIPGSNPIPTLWKNGATEYLTNQIAAQVSIDPSSYGECVNIVGNDLYISGHFYDQGNYYWKDGSLL